MNTFLVLSPSQLVNAIEAKNYFQTHDNTLIVLRHTSQGYPISMFKRLIDETEWNRICYQATYHEEQIRHLNKLQWFFLFLRQRRRLDRLAAELGSTDGLFVGLYIDTMVRHFCNVLPYNTLYALDDGTGTLDTNEERRNPWQQQWSVAAFKNALWNRLLQIRDQHVERLTYFTIYDDLELQEGDGLVPNRYEHFRSQLSVAERSEEVWFLGGPLLTDGYFSEAVYRCYLEQVAEFYRGRPLVYLLHGREGEEDIDRIKKVLRCEIRRFDLPIEVALATLTRRPAEVASFISSALPNCQLMFGDKLDITAFEVQLEDVNVEFRPFFNDIYSHFRRETDDHFKVVALENVGRSARAQH